MKKTTTFYSKFIEGISDASRKVMIDRVSIKTLEGFIHEYHNVFIDHLVKKFEMLKINYTNDDPESSRESYCRGFNDALDQVREMMEGEKT